jgi:glutamyl-tRNA(Gln) amidotransferase subunit E
MTQEFDPNHNYERTRQLVGYVPRKRATPATYAGLGFKCGLEIHQQLKTKEKLFCRCPSGIYQKDGEYDAEVIRHMRPTLSEMGEYDGTALMERKTKKNIIYRIKNETTCTYEIDDTPPFPLNREALEISVQISLLLNLNIVGELHITRKQYLDGSIPTGFQRTAIVGIEGEIPIKNRTVRIIQLSVEEDACREVSDVGHWRVYTTDRLGMPLIETVTYPDMETPDEAAEAAHYLRFLARSTGKVRTGIGAAREDVNVSISGGTRVEIKGVAHIKRIPELTHNEAFRQKALLQIKKILNERLSDPSSWSMSFVDIDFNSLAATLPLLHEAKKQKQRLVAVNLPQFKGLLSFFTQPGKVFADELSGRLKVIACLEKPNMLHSEEAQPLLDMETLAGIGEKLKARGKDAQILVWGPDEDVTTALETIEERCLMAFEGVPNETRQSLADGTTVFERVLPGPDRMYPDTDSAPIPIDDELIEKQRQDLPSPIHYRLTQLEEWQVPHDTYRYILKRNLVGLIEKINEDFDINPKFVGALIGHALRRIEGANSPSAGFDYRRVYDLFAFVEERKLDREIVKKMLPVVYEHPNMDFDSVLTTIDFAPMSKDEILLSIPVLNQKFDEINTSSSPQARLRWIMGNLRKLAFGNISLAELKSYVDKEIAHD